MEFFGWIIAGFSILGVILNVKKKRAGFAIWIFTNAAWVAIDAWAGLWSQAAIFAVYFALAVWGWFAWKDEPREVNFDPKSITINIRIHNYYWFKYRYRISMIFLRFFLITCPFNGKVELWKEGDTSSPLSGPRPQV